MNKDLAGQNKRLDLDIAYGGYQLVIVHEDQGYGESDLSRRLKASEMYEVLYALQNVVRTMQYHDWLHAPAKKG